MYIVPTFIKSLEQNNIRIFALLLVFTGNLTVPIYQLIADDENNTSQVFGVSIILKLEQCCCNPDHEFKLGCVRFNRTEIGRVTEAVILNALQWEQRGGTKPAAGHSVITESTSDKTTPSAQRCLVETRRPKSARSVRTSLRTTHPEDGFKRHKKLR